MKFHLQPSNTSTEAIKGKVVAEGGSESSPHVTKGKGGGEIKKSWSNTTDSVKKMGARQ